MSEKCSCCGGYYKTINKLENGKLVCQNCKKATENEKQYEYCERCLKYNTVSRMNKMQKEPLEVKDKLRKSREFPFQLYQFVYIFYNYFECPICHWFKFKQKEA